MVDCEGQEVGRLATRWLRVDTDICRLGSSIGNALTRWERLLQMVVENQSSFLSVLTDEMVNEVAFTDTKDPKNSPFCEGLYMWLDRILTSSQWEPSRRLLSSSYILAVCDVNSNHWTELLKERIRDAGGSISSGEQGQQGRAPQLPPPMPDDGLKQYGWTFVDTWDSRPLGIVP